MEFCSRCQEIKPYRVAEYYKRLVKNCRDCGFQLGFIELEELNILINERNFYIEKFYETRIKTCQDIE